MKQWPKLLLVGGAVLALALAIRPRAGSAEGIPFVPKNDSEVLERLPVTPGNPRARILAALGRDLQADPKNLELALRLAKMNIEEGRARSDPRYMGYAQAALGPWWEQSSPPPEVLVLRATLRQSAHDFSAALADLDRVVDLAPDEPQAWITRSVILTVQGNYPEARRSCAPLAHLADDLVTAVCTSNIDSLQGHAREAYDRLAHALDTRGSGGSAEEAWALSTLGEVAVRAGQPQAAERHFLRALSLDPADAYLLGAYADLLLDLGRPAVAIGWLRDQTQNDALLLRLAIAEAATGAPGAAKHIGELKSRFEASRTRGDSVHRREEARFELALGKHPKRALELARANWEVQREPWDARVFLEAALGAGEARAAMPVLQALDSNHCEEPKLMELAERARGMLH